LDDAVAEVLSVCPRLSDSLPGNAAIALRHYSNAEQPQLLETRNAWYESVARGQPDYGIYHSEAMIAEMIACYLICSKEYVKRFKSLLWRLRISSVCDLGCGVGLSCIALRQESDVDKVTGAQLPGTLQFDIAKALGEKHRFDVQPEPTKADLVFASEYFEHFERPLDHLHHVLDLARPKYLVVANAFGACSIGHFNSYRFGNRTVSNKAIGRAFNKALRQSGYSAITTKFWNQRPTVWEANRI